MIDTGSVITLMGERCANQLELKTKECEPLTSLADDSDSIITRKIDGLILTIETLHVSPDILIVPQVAYDIILGKDYLQNTNATIKTSQAQLTLGWKGCKETIALHTRMECNSLARQCAQSANTINGNQFVPSSTTNAPHQKCEGKT